ncbi:MAG: cysteine peptidase family C39 domain-containing protein [Caulobacter sp.]
MANGELRHVRQTNRSSGCGPACLAMVANTTESAAIEVLFEASQTRSLHTWWPDLKRGLKALKVRASGRAKRVAVWSRIETPAIVACGRNLDREGEANWHWVVFMPDANGGLVYDPLREGPVPTSRIRRKPFSYLEVTPKQ